MLKNKKIIKCLASLFYIGYLPAPGTIASILPILVYFSLKGRPFVYNIVAIFFLLSSFLIIKKVNTIFQHKDSPHIVLDEIVGMFIAFIFVPFRWTYMITGFVIFRFFDILKIWPLRKIEKLNGALGIILDDVCAGIYTNIILQILLIMKIV